MIRAEPGGSLPAPRRRRARRARRAELRRLHASHRPARRSRSASSSCRRRTRSTSRAAVRAELDRLSRRLPVRRRADGPLRPDAVRVRVDLRGDAHAVRRRCVLVFVVVYVFLQDWRATLIPAVTIPVSLVGTFAVLYAIGFGINTITLFALVLAIGLVVDDAIVVVENVARLLSRGLFAPRGGAALDGRGDERDRRGHARARRGVRAGGAPARHDRPPAAQLRPRGDLRGADLAAQRAHALAGAVRARDAPRARAQGGASSAPSTAASRRSSSATTAACARSFRAARSCSACSRCCSRRTCSCSAAVPTGFIPDEDQGYFITSFQLPDGASLERTDAVAREVETILQGDAGRDRRSTCSAASTRSPAPPRRTSARCFVTLAPWDERVEKGQEIDAIFAHVRPRFAAIPGARVFALNPSPVRGLSRVGGFEFQLQDRGGGTIEELAAVTQRIDRGGRAASPELQNLFTTLPPERAAGPRRPRPHQGQDARRARWTTCSRRSRRSWAASTSTTSTASGGCSACTRRPRAICARARRT